MPGKLFGYLTISFPKTFLKNNKHFKFPQPPPLDAPSSVEPAVGHPRLWFSLPVPSLYLRPSFSATLPCSVWGQSGTFRVFLRVVTSAHQPQDPEEEVVARSRPIRVDANPVYAVRY